MAHIHAQNLPDTANGARQRRDDVYRVMRRRIALLDYPPGLRLSEEALAKEFGISRTPLRRVLARLEDEGLVRSVHGVGTIVTDLDLASMAQVYAIRMELAEMIGRLDPARDIQAPQAAFLGVREACQALAAEPDIRAFAQTNVEFFEALMLLTENQPLRQLNRRLYYQTTRIWISSLGSSDLPEELTIFCREVADIIAAVALGDLVAVGHIRRSHISMSFRRLRAKNLNNLVEP